MEDDISGILLQAMERKDEEIDHLHKLLNYSRNEIHMLLDETVSLKDELMIAKTEGQQLLAITKDLAARNNVLLCMPVCSPALWDYKTWIHQIPKRKWEINGVIQ
jgi:hypothetical protein